LASAITFTQGQVNHASVKGDDVGRAVVQTGDTEAAAYLEGDGSGFVEVHREGILIHRFNIAPDR
jgi:hypothetical protein